MAKYIRSDGAKIELIPDPFCKWCCKPIGQSFSQTTGTCYGCYREYGNNGYPPISIRAVSLYVLHGGWKDSQLSRDVWALKDGDSTVVDKIGECMVYVLNERFKYLKNANLIVPAPITDTGRSYNQAYLLAQYISSEIGIELQDVLYKTPHNPQHKTPWRKKEENIKGKIKSLKRIDGERVLLIDDTYNTGNTAKECALILRNMGAVDVTGLMAVRTIDKSSMYRLGLLHF